MKSKKSNHSENIKIKRYFYFSMTISLIILIVAVGLFLWTLRDVTVTGEAMAQGTALETNLISNDPEVISALRNCLCQGCVNSTSSLPNCVDNDEGINLNVGGSVTVTDNKGISNNFLDSCMIGGDRVGLVKEYYCENGEAKFQLLKCNLGNQSLGCNSLQNACGVPMTQNYVTVSSNDCNSDTDCAFGKECLRNICIVPEQNLTCTETDSGRDYNHKGTATLKFQGMALTLAEFRSLQMYNTIDFPAADTCLDGSNIKEYACIGNSLRKITGSCTTLTNLAYPYCNYGKCTNIQ